MTVVQSITEARSATPQHRRWVAENKERAEAEAANREHCSESTRHAPNRHGTAQGVCIHCNRMIAKRADGRWVAT